jgi:hypothetical protein
MPKALTQDEFINRSKLFHKNKYDYSLVVYKNAYTKIKIICPIHGEFEQTPDCHRKYGCKKCGKLVNIEKTTLTTQKFIDISTLKHKSKYDYSLVEYIGSERKVKIICPIHGIFEQTAHTHIYGKGCRKCGIMEKVLKTRGNLLDFISKAKEIHGDRYDYSVSQYIDSQTPIKIICSKHGIFEQPPDQHLSHCGCRNCYLDSNGNKTRKTLEEFIERANKIHNNLYRYDKFIYVNAQTKGIIICPIHGEFLQNSLSHIGIQCGCPICKKSKGEKLIYNYLKRKNILFEPQKSFDDCRGKKNKLPFDFYISNYKIAIEYQGEQHFKPIKGWGGEKTFERIKYNDNIKKEYCNKNNIHLIEIPYYEKEPLVFLEQCITQYISNNKSGLELL